jgi:hypothetical protein
VPGTVPVHIHVGVGVPERLREAVDGDKPAAAWLRKERAEEAKPLDLDGAGRAAWQAETAELVVETRRNGIVLDTLASAIEWGARQELAARGWDHDWPAPAREAFARGRWPGSTDEAVPKRIHVRVDADLEAQVRAACWATSAEAITALRTWRDDHPDKVYQIRELAKYNALAEQVTTTGDIWRAAVNRAVARKKPPQPGPP